MRLEPLVCALFARPSAANSRRHRPPEWLLAGARPALRSSRKASPTGRSAVEDMMELGLTRAPIRRGSDAEPEVSLPPTAAGSRTIQDGPQSTPCGHSTGRRRPAKLGFPECMLYD